MVDKGRSVCQKVGQIFFAEESKTIRIFFLCFMCSISSYRSIFGRLDVTPDSITMKSRFDDTTRCLFKNPCDTQYLQDGIVESDELNLRTCEKEVYVASLYGVVKSNVLAKRF